MPDIRLLKGVEELVAQGIKSTATLGNSHYLQFVRNRSQLTDQHQAVLLDPQTSGVHKSHITTSMFPSQTAVRVNCGIDLICVSTHCVPSQTVVHCEGTSDMSQEV